MPRDDGQADDVATCAGLAQSTPPPYVYAGGVVDRLSVRMRHQDLRGSWCRVVFRTSVGRNAVAPALPQGKTAPNAAGEAPPHAATACVGERSPVRGRDRADRTQRGGARTSCPGPAARVHPVVRAISRRVRASRHPHPGLLHAPHRGSPRPRPRAPGARGSRGTLVEVRAPIAGRRADGDAPSPPRSPPARCQGGSTWPAPASPRRSARSCRRR